jgi:hypothetical protein
LKISSQNFVGTYRHLVFLSICKHGFLFLIWFLIKKCGIANVPKNSKEKQISQIYTRKTQISQFLVKKQQKILKDFFLDHKLVIFPTMENGMFQPRSFEYNVLYVTMGDIQSLNWMIKNSHQNHKIHFYLSHNWMTFYLKTLFMWSSFFTLRIVYKNQLLLSTLKFAWIDFAFSI